MPRQFRENALILLYVNSRNAAGEPIQFSTQEITENNVFMTDTSGDTADDTGSGLPDFNSKVKPNGTVTWVGAVSNHVQAPKDYVIITGVTVTNVTPAGKGLNNIRRLPNPGLGDYVQAKVVGPDDAEITYTIYFNVHTIDSQGNDTYQQCHIDPKLKIDPTDSGS